jgi:hypothetical protein
MHNKWNAFVTCAIFIVDWFIAQRAKDANTLEYATTGEKITPVE